MRRGHDEVLEVMLDMVVDWSKICLGGREKQKFESVVSDKIIVIPINAKFKHPYRHPELKRRGLAPKKLKDHKRTAAVQMKELTGSIRQESIEPRGQ